MVRINVINPKKLTDQHLIAEQVEILMLMSYILKNPKMDGSEPKEFTLNTGHMKFFRNKVRYLKLRYYSIHKEILKRGFNHEYKFPDINPDEVLYNDWNPSKKDFDIIIERIRERVNLKPHWYRYYGKPLTKNQIDSGVC